MRFIHNQPVLFIEEISALVIADLHIGLETELFKSGINIPTQINKMKDQIEKLIKKTKAKRLVILGDIKHEVPGISFQEQREIPIFLEELSKTAKIDICLGNHDTFLKNIVPQGIKVHSSKGFKIKNFGFFHGHAWPSPSLLVCDYIIISHIHPAIEFKDGLGYRVIKPVWVKSKLNLKKIYDKYKRKKKKEMAAIIIPSFNKLISGSPINIKNKIKNSEEMLGPLLKNDFIDMKKADIYLLDGTFLGKTRNLNSR